MDRHDIPTAVAIGFSISVFSTFGHEAIGHGAACVLTGCDPVQFSSTYFIGNKAGLSDSAIRTISLGGTLFNLVLGLAFLALLRMTAPRAPARRYYVLWFGSMVNLVSAAGYIFFGSAFAFGDYKTILEGAGLPLRIGCILLGAVLYFGALWVVARGLLQWFVGDGKGEPARTIARSRTWWIAAALVVLAVGAVGPGVPRATRAETRVTRR